MPHPECELDNLLRPYTLEEAERKAYAEGNDVIACLVRAVLDARRRELALLQLIETWRDDGDPALLSPQAVDRALELVS